MGVTAPATKKELREMQAKAAQDIKRLQLQADAREALVRVRANVHTKMNRARRRKAAKTAGVFRYPGLWVGIFNPDQKEELRAKTIRKVT